MIYRKIVHACDIFVSYVRRTCISQSGERLRDVGKALAASLKGLSTYEQSFSEYRVRDLFTSFGEIGPKWRFQPRPNLHK